VLILNSCSSGTRSLGIGDVYQPCPLTDVAPSVPFPLYLANVAATQTPSWPDPLPAGAAPTIVTPWQLVSVDQPSLTSPAPFRLLTDQPPPYVAFDFGTSNSRVSMAPSSVAAHWSYDAPRDLEVGTWPASTSLDSPSLEIVLTRTATAVSLPLAESVIRFAIVIRLAPRSDLGDDLLRLVDRIRAALCLRLVLLRSRLRRPYVRSFALILLATSRCYGRRGEPDDRTLPAHHRSVSIVAGEFALAV
jgi:hypothetical protein